MSLSQQRKRVIQVLATLAITGALIATIVSWPQLLEAYYHHQLERAEGEDAWMVAAKLAELRSTHAEDWYRLKLADDEWAKRVRAGKQLAAMGTETSITELLNLRQPLEGTINPPRGRGRRFYAGGFLSLGSTWTVDDTQAALDMLNKRLEASNSTATSQGPGQIHFAYDDKKKALPSRSHLATSSIQMIAQILSESDDRTRSTLDRIAESAADLSVRRDASVIRKLLPNPQSIIPMYIST